MGSHALGGTDAPRDWCARHGNKLLCECDYGDQQSFTRGAHGKCKQLWPSLGLACSSHRPKYCGLLVDFVWQKLHRECDDAGYHTFCVLRTHCICHLRTSHDGTKTSRHIQLMGLSVRENQPRKKKAWNQSLSGLFIILLQIAGEKRSNLLLDEQLLYFNLIFFFINRTSVLN